VSSRWMRFGSTAIFAIAVASLALPAPAHAAPRRAAPVRSPASTHGPLTPADQASLDAAASVASKIAGSRYFTYVTVDTSTKVVTVYLDHAPRSILRQIRELHGDYVIHDRSAHPMSALLRLQSAISAKVLAWARRGVALSYLEPTASGHLRIGVTSDLSTARSRLEAVYGRGWIRVVRNRSQPILATLRYNDVSAWNGGDFIYHLSSTAGFSDCTSGIPVHNTSSGTQYMLTASHCFWPFANNGVGTTVLNGYVENTGSNKGSVYPNSSRTLIGDVTKDSNVSAGTTSLDVALIQASTSTVDFDAAWNATGRAVQIGTSTNTVGDQVCTSGAFDGQVCGLVIKATDVTECPIASWGKFCVNHLAKAKSNTSGVVAAGTGDSGGPVYSYSGSNLLANGMIDQIDTNSQVSCTSKPPGMSRECSTIVYYVEMPHINSNWGVAPNS